MQSYVNLKNCSPVDALNSDCLNTDFMYAGWRYTFATVVFEKKINGSNYENVLTITYPENLLLSFKEALELAKET